ncbi:MAG: LysM peptidoglycan-binding domain-containing protein [Pirellulales bacterium]
MKEKFARDGKSFDATAADAANAAAGNPTDDGLTPMESLMMRREVRIGMAIIAILVLIFGYVFVQKINENGSAATPVADSQRSSEPAANEAAAADPPPTVVTGDAGYRPIVGSPSVAAGRGGAYATDVAHDDLSPPNKSYLPPRSAIDATATYAAKPGDTQESDVSTAIDHRSAASDHAKYLPNDVPRVGVTAPPDAPAYPHDGRGVALAGDAATDAPSAVASSDDAARTAASRYADSPPRGIADYPVADHGEGNAEPPPAKSIAIEATPVDEPSPIVEPIPTHDTPAASDPPAGIAQQPAADEPRNRTYVTVNGDTPASIAERLYGDDRYAAALMAYNGVDIAPDVGVNAGGEVLVPQLVDLRRAFAQLIPDDSSHSVAADVATANAPRDQVPNNAAVANRDDVAAHANNVATRVYQVARGETVYDIARKELGRVSRWREILQLNQDQLGGDIDAVAPGMKLRLPEDGRAEVARQRGELLWR